MLCFFIELEKKLAGGGRPPPPGKPSKPNKPGPPGPPTKPTKPKAAVPPPQAKKPSPPPPATAKPSSPPPATKNADHALPRTSSQSGKPPPVGLPPRSNSGSLPRVPVMQKTEGKRSFLSNFLIQRKFNSTFLM